MRPTGVLERYERGGSHGYENDPYRNGANGIPRAQSLSGPRCLERRNIFIW